MSASNLSRHLNYHFNPFPNKPWFLPVCSTSLLKTLWEKEKLLVTSNFSFTHSVFYPFRELSAIFIDFEIVVCKLFQFERHIKFVVCERVNIRTDNIQRDPSTLNCWKPFEKRRNGSLRAIPPLVKMFLWKMSAASFLFYRPRYFCIALILAFCFDFGRAHIFPAWNKWFTFHRTVTIHVETVWKMKGQGKLKKITEKQDNRGVKRVRRVVERWFINNFYHIWSQISEYARVFPRRTGHVNT